MNFTKILLLLTTFMYAKECRGYRVLGIYPFPGKSHYKMMKQVLLGLARKGHQVDLISVLPNATEEHPNFRQIITFSDASKKVEAFKDKFLTQNNLNFRTAITIGNILCESMNDSKFVQLAKNPPKDPPYDVIIVHFLNYNCFTILGHLWNIPVVAISTTSLYPWMHDMIANPENLAFSPNNFLVIPRGNTFWSRFWNVYYSYFLKLNYLYYTSDQTQIIRNAFGPEAPTVRELERQISLVLVNSFFPVSGAKPMTTAVVEVGGLHIQNEGPELSESLKQWLDESEKGVIYFSLGSMFRLETFPRDIINIIFSTLARIKPYRILIKIEKLEELPVAVPENMYALSWLPQEKVLQHPNVKLFVTHGGLLATEESVYYGVPMLCIPLLVDQTTITNNYLDLQVARTVNLETITQGSFDFDVTEMLTNPMYKRNAEKLSKLYKDRPLSPLDTAIFWIEFVVRNGKDSLRSRAMDLTWWEVALLDVFAVTYIGLAVFLYVAIRLSVILFNIVRHRREAIIIKAKKYV